MRVLATTTGLPGPLHAVAPFARACARARHEACVVGPRTAGPLVRRLGLAFCGYTDPPREELRTVIAAAADLAPEQGHALVITEAFGRVAPRAMLSDVLRALRAGRSPVTRRKAPAGVPERARSR
jgi:hypothetical protein